MEVAPFRSVSHVTLTSEPHDDILSPSPLRSNSKHREDETVVGHARLAEAQKFFENATATTSSKSVVCCSSKNDVEIRWLRKKGKRKNNFEAQSSEEASVFHSIFNSIQGLYGRLFYTDLKSERGGDEDESDEDDDEDDDIDNLAVFQGTFTEYFELQKETLPLNKINELESLLKDDNHEIWKLRCSLLMTSSILNHGLIKQLESYRAKLKAYLGSWNPVEKHCSNSIFLLDDQLTVHRVPMVNRTDGVRGRLGVRSGVHAWDLKVTGPMGTHFTVGVTTEEALLWNKIGYLSLIGDDEHGWGWDVVWGNVSHNGKAFGAYPPVLEYEYVSGDIIRLILDCNKGELSFAVNEMSFGKAFTNLPMDVPLYPAVGMVYGNMEVTLIYLGIPPPLRN